MRRGDEEARAVPSQIIPGPLHHDEQAVLKGEKFEEVNKSPNPPGEKTVEPQPTQVDNGGISPDRGGAPRIMIVKRRTGLVLQPSLDHLGGIAPLLHGDG